MKNVPIHSRSMNRLNKALHQLIEQAKELGLSNDDYMNAKEFINHHEAGLAFDTVITQLIEQSIIIDVTFFNQAVIIAKLMKLPDNNCDFIRKLIVE